MSAAAARRGARLFVKIALRPGQDVFGREGDGEGHQAQQRQGRAVGALLTRWRIRRQARLRNPHGHFDPCTA